MKIGLFGIDTNTDENYFLKVKEALGTHLAGIYSPQHYDLMPISEKFGVKLYKSSEEIFTKTDAIFFSKSLKPNYEFAIKAIKSSCHLFLEDLSALSMDETKQLFKVAFEARTNIHIKQSMRFTPEYCELSDYIENPTLIELNTDFISLIRKQDYFSNLFTRLCFANELIKSGIKKASTIALPTDRNHFSLVQIRVDYDNGTFLNIKFNNLASEKSETARIFQKNNSLEIDFTNHFAVKHTFDNGHITRTELPISKGNDFKNEIDYFVNLCTDSEQENISESPSVLKTLLNTNLLMEQLEQISIKS